LNGVAAAIADMLDGLNAAVFLVDAGARIIHSNVAGNNALMKRDVVRRASGRLAAREADADRNLLEAICAAGCGTDSKRIAVSLATGGGTRYVAHVLSLNHGARRREGANYDAVAAVFVNEAVLIRTPPELIAKIYRLTPTELRVLMAIVDVGGVPDVAEALRIAESTVKTHLGHLFEKTGVARQADLVKIVAGFSNPMVG
jgi:DNA-binding CsgD family transcriptional regulator